MAHYGYAQLQKLWVQAGGSKRLAPLMAAIALAESNGNEKIVNSIGASGLWQIHPQEPGSLNALTNARQAVRKYRTQGLGAWEAYTNGHYKAFLHGPVSLRGVRLPRGGGGGGTGSTVTAEIPGQSHVQITSQNTIDPEVEAEIAKLEKQLHQQRVQSSAGVLTPPVTPFIPTATASSAKVPGVYPGSAPPVIPGMDSGLQQQIDALRKIRATATSSAQVITDPSHEQTFGVQAPHHGGVLHGLGISAGGSWGGSKKEIDRLLAAGGVSPGQITSTKRNYVPPGGSTTSDHLTSHTNAYAADVQPNPAAARRIARALGVTNFHYGQNVTVTRGHFQYQLLTAPHGTGPHMHVGAHRIR